MRNKFLLIVLLLMQCIGVFSQNKTLGVGTATPNQNAALHVESPTNNQGFIMPRLTSAQRFAMSLAGTDIGLMVYDIDVNSVFTWDGSLWSEAGKLSFPYSDTILSAPNGSNLFRVVYAGSAVENVGVAHFENLNANSGFSALFVRTNSATNGALDVVVNNAANNNDAIGVVTNGTGTGIRSTQNGTGIGTISIVNNAAGLNPAIWAQTNSNQPLSAAIYGLNTGTGDVAGSFRITNASNTFSSLYGETNGSGSAVFANQLGTGRSGLFQISNVSSTAEAFRATTNGTGTAGRFIINNTSAVSNNAIYATTNSSGGNSSAIRADHTGTAGYAGIIQSINASNPAAALFVEAVGTGPSIWANKDPSETGNTIEATHSGTAGSAGNFMITNASNAAAALNVETNGMGFGVRSYTTGTENAGYFEINNPATINSALAAITNGTANAVVGVNSGTGRAATFDVTNASNSQTTMDVRTLGTGSAGYFEVDNAANGFPVNYSRTNGTGTVIQANHTGASGNIAIFQSSDVNVARIDKTGRGFFNGGTQASGADVAEMFGVEGARNDYEPGDVLVISESTDRTVEKSISANSTKVAGVYATKPGVILTEKSIEENLDELVPMGVVGVIPTKVCLENGPIKRGDLLVTSSTKGHAMKAVPVIINGIEIYPTGAILGKALENFESGEKGLIKVLVNAK